MKIINRTTYKIYYTVVSNHSLTLDEALDLVAPDGWRDHVNSEGSFYDDNLNEEIFYDDLEFVKSVVIPAFSAARYNTISNRDAASLDLRYMSEAAKEWYFGQDCESACKIDNDEYILIDRRGRPETDYNGDVPVYSLEELNDMYTTAAQGYDEEE